jgi:hypothetical protein
MPYQDPAPSPRGTLTSVPTAATACGAASVVLDRQSTNSSAGSDGYSTSLAKISDVAAAHQSLPAVVPYQVGDDAHSSPEWTESQSALRQLFEETTQDPPDPASSQRRACAAAARHGDRDSVVSRNLLSRM